MVDYVGCMLPRAKVCAWFGCGGWSVWARLYCAMVEFRCGMVQGPRVELRFLKVGFTHLGFDCFEGLLLGF